MAYSRIEKNVASVLAKFPGLKSTIKRSYSIVNFYLNRKKYIYKSEHNVEAVLSDENNESFFGYYDKSPVNSSGKYIIFHETDGPVKITLYDVEKNKYNSIAETSAYNWQQGSRLMWLNKTSFIFNDFDGSDYISKIYNLQSKEFTFIESPIYDCYKEQFALSVNFSRLYSTDKDYGYKNIAFNPVQNTLENDGIYLVDLKNNTTKLLINFEKVIAIHLKDSMKNAQHCFNHIMISPDGKNFIFIHRWYQAGRRYDSLILSNFEGTKIKVLADQDFVSHCCWYDNQNIVGYMRDKSFGNSFYRINIVSGKIELLSAKLTNLGDGHPSFFGNKMLFDSYPDRSRMQHLYIFDIDKNEIKEIGCFLSPLKFFGETRCDLHPRWSPDGKSIYFDSTHECKRKLYKFMINE